MKITYEEFQVVIAWAFAACPNKDKPPITYCVDATWRRMAEHIEAGDEFGHRAYQGFTSSALTLDYMLTAMREGWFVNKERKITTPLGTFDVLEYQDRWYALHQAA